MKLRHVVAALICLAVIANHASAGLLVSSTKVGTKVVGGTNFDIWSVKVTGFDGAQDVPGNYLQGVDFGSNAENPTFGLTGLGGAFLSTNGANSAIGKSQFSSAFMGGGDGTFDGTAGTGSWFNFDSYAGAFTRTGTATTTTKVSAVMFAGDPVNGSLRPVDVNAGTPDDDFIDQTLLGQIFVSAGGSAGFQGQAGFKIGGTAPFSFVVGNDIPPGDPILVSSNPPNGTTLAIGETITLTNAAAVPPNLRDTAGIANISITTNPGSPGEFYTAGGILGPSLAPGVTRKTPTIYYSFPGLLNGAAAQGNLHFDIVSGPNGVGIGSGSYDFPLSATARDHVGDGIAPVPAGGSYAGLSSTSGLRSIFETIHLPSTATILAGSNNVGGATTVEMTWSLRAVNEQPAKPTSPPLPSFASGLLSDKVYISGIDDKFVIQMTYDTASWKGNELNAFNAGHLFLAAFDGTIWVNAVLLSTDGGAGATKVLGPWSGQTALGTWGADLNANVVWAVVDHGAYFASVPEPSSLVSLLGLLGCVALPIARKRRKH